MNSPCCPATRPSEKSNVCKRTQRPCRIEYANTPCINEGMQTCCKFNPPFLLQSNHNGVHHVLSGPTRNPRRQSGNQCHLDRRSRRCNRRIQRSQTVNLHRINRLRSAELPGFHTSPTTFSGVFSCLFLSSPSPRPSLPTNAPSRF